jgi:hypothetical protein
MALGTYAQLKAAVIVWSKRADVLDKVDDFIDLCETEIYSNSIEPLRIRAMVQLETSATSAIARTQALPTGFLQTRKIDLTVGNQRVNIDYVTPSHQFIRQGTGTPSNYTITSQIEYDIIPSVAFVTNHSYYGKLSALSDAATTNAILTNYPNIYLYGSLMTLNQWAENVEEFSKYQNLFIQAISGANNQDEQGNRGVATQRRRNGRNP